MSGGIWQDWEDYNDYSDYTDIYRPDGKSASERNRADIIESAREDFAKEADKLKQELMKLLSIVPELEQPSSEAWIPEKVIEVCKAVFNLSMDTANETERDMFAICDLLTISLAATCAEKASELFDIAEISGSDIPYLSKAFAVLNM